MQKNTDFRKQLARIMLILGIIPILLLLFGVSIVIKSVIDSEREGSQEIYDTLLEITGHGFMQSEDFQYVQVLEIGALLLYPNGGASASGTLDDIYEKLQDMEMLRLDSCLFIASGGKITAVAGTDMRPSEFDEYMGGIVDPVIPEIFSPESFGGSTLRELLSREENMHFYSSEPLDSSFLIQWTTLPDGRKLGAFTASGYGQFMIHTLSSLVSDMQEQSRKNINSILMRGGVALGAVISALSAAIIYLSKRLSSAVSEPVERRDQHQKDLLQASEKEKETLEKLNQMKTEFLSTVSHELKTPLTVISSHLQTGQQDLIGEIDVDSLNRRMKLVISEAERLALMVGQLLDVSRIDENRMAVNKREESIVEVIQATLDTYYQMFSKNHNRLVFLHEVDTPPVFCDRTKVAQVLVNLISNASRHMRNGEITISVRRAGGFAAVTVSDTGSGIEAERIPRLFERYGGVKIMDDPGALQEPGTGLGLYICKHVVEAHGGAIEITSELGKGTDVRFTLPLSTL